MASPFRPAELGFSDKVVRSWDAALPRDTRVLVPVHLDALVVRSPGGTWADCRMRAPAEGGSTRSVDLLPDPFADLPTPRGPGVYLHWAMPDGLSDVRAGGATAVAPALPDRWLVVRIAGPARGGRPVAAWVLDARSGAPPVPLDRWTPAAPAGPPVTVLGIGDAGWAAYYDNVADRFAFHDPLEGVTAGPLGYLVCGWYADAAQDPLTVNLSSLAAFEAHLAGLRWGLSRADLQRVEKESFERLDRTALAGLSTAQAVRSASGEVMRASAKTSVKDALGKPLRGVYSLAQRHWPRSTLFHGAVVGIAWPRPADGSPEVGGPPSPAVVEVALGATPADALAALVSKATGAATDGEWLNAFALGALDELSQPDGAVRLDDRLHEAAFASRADGVERVAVPPTSLPERPPKPPDPPRPPVKGGKGAVAREEALSRVASLSRDASAAGLTELASGAVRADAAARPTKAAWAVREAAFHEVHLSAPRGRTVDPTEIDLPRPRLYLPADPVIAIQGGLRSPKHGEDGRYSPEGLLMCRLSGTAVTRLSCRTTGAGGRAVVRGAEVLQRPLAHGGIPPECEELLEELGIFDPGSALPIAEKMVTARTTARATGTLAADAVSRRVATEQTAWWALRSPAVDAQAITAASGLEGTLPSPVAVRPAQRPWVPLHLDWEVEVLSTPAAAWTPGEIDFGPPPVPAGPGERFRGRALCSGGLAATLARSLRRYLAAEEVGGGSALAKAGPADALDDLAAQLEKLDVLAGPLEDLHLALRRDIPPDAPATAAPPPGFVAVRAGFLRLVRLRLVDAFGQVLYLAGSGPGDAQVADPTRVAVGTGFDVPGAPGTLALPPRFTAPTKVTFRFRDAGQPGTDATREHVPVCGWAMPDHLDGALELFDAAGGAVGQLRSDPDHGSVWELAPGLPTAVGASPREAVPHPEVGLMAEELLRQTMADAAAGRTPALLELLRVIDSTRWTVDPFAHVGEEHLALLVGHPVALVAAALKVEVREPVAGTDVPVTRVPVRLGALSHWQDGLFGFFVGGDYGRFHCAAAAAAFARPRGPEGFLGPIGAVPSYAAHFADDLTDTGGATPAVHPYLDTSGVLWVVPGVEYPLLLLVEPHAVVHCTTCLLPRKQLGVQREWMAPALSKMAPTFRFGPVLVDPKQVRMPIPADIGAAWTWTHRADVDRWVEEEIVHAGHEAILPPDPAVGSEGWLKLTPKEPETKAGGGGGTT